MNISKVLLVDDDPNIVLIATIGLEDRPNWTVVTANSGSEAVQKAVSEKPDIILLDMMMPGMDGITAFKKIKEIESCKNIPIIFMTAKVQRDEVAAYLDLGAAGVVMKPFDPMKLSDQVLAIANSAESQSLQP